MDLSKIITVAGKTGLFRVVAQGRQAIIAESLADGKRVPVHTTQRVSTLEEIRMFTTGDDVPLGDVLKKLFEVEKGGETIDPHSEPDALYAKLGEVLPDHDRERIYPNDVRKLFTWYHQLLKAGVFTQKDEPKEGEGEGEKLVKAEAGAGKTKERSSVAVKKANAPKPGGGTKAKTAGSTMRKGSQRGS
ncbi:MAG: DUF5606 domain-containing protein [Flavobacteriales bacterium]|nr:DUF5606 domain-containing protein [Flavobacteriales bacterium]